MNAVDVNVCIVAVVYVVVHFGIVTAVEMLGPTMI